MSAVDMPMPQQFRLLRSKSEHTLCLMTQRQVDAGGDYCAVSQFTPKLLSPRPNRIWFHPTADDLAFAQKAKQHVHGLNVRGAESARLIAGEEDRAPGFLCVALEHIV